MTFRLSNPSAIALLFALSLVSLLLAAEEHGEMAIEHAAAAAKSTDSRDVAKHATEALKHTEAAKAATEDQDTLKHLEKSEAELNSAVQNARWHNTGRAIEDAQDSMKHLEQAGSGH